MFDLAEMAARHRRALAEITEQGLAAAREIQARLLSAESLEEAAAAGLALQRMHRSVRQSVALEIRVAGELRRIGRDDRKAAQAEAQAAVERRKAQVRAAVEQQVRAEYESDDADELVEDLDTLITAEALDEGFTETPVATHVTRLRAALGMAPLEPVPPKSETRGAEPPGAEPARPAPDAPGLAFDAAPLPRQPDDLAPAWRSSA